MITLVSEKLEIHKHFIQVKDHPIFPQSLTYSTKVTKRTPRLYLFQISKDPLEKKMSLLYFT